ncbi:MAG: FtsQ-type POTRA domain-containing protein [Clostridia bacterium]|nr:FtsQ-type POTRA domain-containing protein [Clostridia bacterium]
MVTGKEEREKLRRRRKIRFWSFLILFVMLAGGIIFCIRAPYFAVKEYRVNGNSYYTDEEIAIMGNCIKGPNIFVGVDYKEIRKRLLKDTYIRDVSFKRALPDAVEITVKERNQVACFRYSSSYLVIDDEGMYLRKTGVVPKLTILDGFTLSKITLGENIEVEESVQLNQALGVLKTMEENDMFFYMIRYSEAEMKAYVLENLVVVGSPSDIIKKLKDKSIQATVSKLLNQGIEYGSIIITDTNVSDEIIFTPVI